MTTDVLKVSGNYEIKTANRGTITLDVRGSAEDGGTVVVRGNLSVLGETTTVSSEETTVRDNILVLNSGETGIGVTLGTAGIRVARGNADSLYVSADLLYNDDITVAHPSGSITGVWQFGTNNNPFVGRAIQVGAIIPSQGTNTLTLLSSYNPNAILSVRGTTNYEDHIHDDDDIPNKAYVDRVSTGTANYTKKLQVGSSYVEINDSDVDLSDPYYSTSDKIFAVLGTPTNVVFKLEGTSAAFKGLTLQDNSIVANTGTDIVLQVSSGNSVKSFGPLKIKSSAPIANESGYTSVYSTSTVGGGGTGLYYVNSSNSDELVSRRRSIIYGIIF